MNTPLKSTTYKTLLARIALWICISAINICSAPIGLAANATWIGSVANWSDASNWSTLAIPDSSGIAVLTNGGEVTVNSNVGTVTRVQICDSTLASGGTLLIDPGANLTGTTMLVAASSGTNGPIVGRVYQTGGTLTVTNEFYLGRNDPKRKAIYELSGGTLTGATLYIGGRSTDTAWAQGAFSLLGGDLSLSGDIYITNLSLLEVSAGSISTLRDLIVSGTLRVRGSEAEIININRTLTLAGTLDFQVDNDGVSWINKASSITLGGALTASFKGGVALTATQDIPVLEAPTFANTPSAFTSLPPSDLWNPHIITDFNGTKDALVLSYQPTANRGNLAYSGTTLATLTLGTSAARGYATLTQLHPGEPVFVYLAVNPGTDTAQNLISYMQKYGVRATSSDISGYDIRLSLCPTAQTSYLAWDIVPFNSAALITAAAVIKAPTQGSTNYVTNSGFEYGISGWTWEIFGNAPVLCSLDQEQPHWEGLSIQLSCTATIQTSQSARLSQNVTGLTVGNTYYAYVWCKSDTQGSANTIVFGNTTQTIPSGTYDWRYIEVPFTATQTSALLAINLQSQTNSLWIDDVYVTSTRLTNVNSLGIYGDGSTNVTSLLASALNNQRFLYLPAGTYITNTTLTLPTNAVIWGDGSASSVQNSAPVVILSATGTDTAYVGNNEISGIRFLGANGQRAIILKKAANVLVRNCYAEVCGLLMTYHSKTGGYAALTSENDLSRNFRVVYNHITNPAGVPATSYAGINICYTTDAEVCWNTISWLYHGIAFVGGNSDYSVNGAWANPRWCRRIYVAGNDVRNVSMGGIWGSMGDNVLVENNVISTCGDVALDFEGCFNSTGQYNFVSDGHNASLAVFAGTKNQIFLGNVVRNNAGYPNLYKNWHSADGTDQGTMDHQIVTLEGNRLTMTSGIGAVRLTATSISTVKNNLIHNGYITAMSTMVGAGPITGNSLLFSVDTPDTLSAIAAQYRPGTFDISNNFIRYAGPTQSNKIGIQVPLLYGGGWTVNMNKNLIAGCGQYDIYFYCSYSASGTCNDNIVQNGNITIGKQSTVTMSATGNVNFSAASVPLTWIP